MAAGLQLVDITMRCPECNALNENGSSACTTCGLLLVKLAPPKRRRDDGAEKRRASDKNSACPFCKGEIAPEAVYCKHCQQILSEEYRVKTTKRLRANINYASWVAYVFGLVTFLLFKPVGMISIGAGLILSIIYYALPEADRQPRGDKKGLASIWPYLKAQFRLDRIPVPIPTLNTKRIVFVGTPLIAALVGYLANFIFLQQPMNQVLQQDAAFAGIKISTHYKYWVVPSEIIYNLEGIADKNTSVEVHRVFLEYAKRMKNRKFENIELQFRGNKRFNVEGAVFQRLGLEYDNFVNAKFPASDAAVSDQAIREFQEWYEKELPATTAQAPAR
jgi:hypothetical protein